MLMMSKVIEKAKKENQNIVKDTVVIIEPDVIVPITPPTSQLSRVSHPVDYEMTDEDMASQILASIDVAVMQRTVEGQLAFDWLIEFSEGKRGSYEIRILT